MKLKPTLKERKLEQVTARDFGGGLNKVDSEFNLSSRYAVDGYNMLPDENNSLQVRWGTRLFANFATVLSGRIVAIEYFFSYLIAVDTNGMIAAGDATGAVTVVWSTAIAAALPGTPAGWSTTVRANFTQFLGALIVVNGTDKPVVISTSLVATYLQDLGSGSNIHTPITKYVVAHSNYVVMAGDPAHPGRLYISNAGTSGTWVGDALPNDAITFDVDKYAPDSTGEIVGLVSFRDKLVVFFSEYIVTVQLGSYNTAVPPVHTPTVDDLIESFGAVSHKAIINVGDQVVFLDYTGVSSIRKATFTNQLTPTRVSTLVDVSVQSAFGSISRSFLQDNCYAVYDKRENRILFFIPTIGNASVIPSAPAMSCFVVSLRKSQYVWSKITNWTFQCGTVSTEGRVFFGVAGIVYRYGSKGEPILSDYEGVNAYDGAAEDKCSVYVNGVLCSASTLATGIRFYHEFPYSEFKNRTAWKTLHYLTMDTQGASRFTFYYALDDRFKRDVVNTDPWSDGTIFTDGTGWAATDIIVYASMTFIGGDRGALGVTLPTQTVPYRATDNMGLYALYGRFKFIKPILAGRSHSHLRIVSMSLYYTMGNIY